MNKLICLLAILTLSACVNLTANVQSFSEIPTPYANKKVAVLGYPKEINESLEWKSYKPALESQFHKQGFIISNENDADYIAFVTYGISDGKTTTQVGSVPQYGSTGGGTTYHSGSVSTMSGGYGSYSGSSYSMPTYGVIGSSNYSYNTTEYKRTLAINLVDKSTNKKVYEGKAISTGSCGLIGEVIDEIAEALFQKFPTGSGKVTITEGKADC